jgi:EAL domain-containing protein (putative c-di-GMP-specific phosphodiesterase class I)
MIREGSDQVDRLLEAVLDLEAQAVNDIGVSFGIATTAEGVETEEQMRYLRQEGYTEVQGYLFGKPSPASVIRAVVSDRSRIDHEPPPLKWSGLRYVS